MPLIFDDVADWGYEEFEKYLEEQGLNELVGDLKDDVIAVLQFFCNENLVKEGLANFASEYYTFVQKEPKKNMRAFFDHWAKQNHFNNPENGISLSHLYKLSPEFAFPHFTPILYGELKPELFYLMLKQGYLSSDPGAGTKHGKWSHSIQTFLLEEARKAGNLKLHSQTIKDFITNIAGFYEESPSHNLWMLLFDSFEEEVFTCPDNIRAALATMNNNKAQQFLSEKLAKHKDKVTTYNTAHGTGAYSKQKYLDQATIYVLQESKVHRNRVSGLLWFQQSEDNSSQKKNAEFDDNPSNGMNDL